MIACKSGQPVVTDSSSSDSSLDQAANFSVESQDLLRKQKELKIQRYKPSASREFDILHTDLDLQFDWENQTVTGKARLTIKPFFYPQKVLVLDAKDFEVGTVGVVVGDSLQKLSYRYNERELSVFLPKELTVKDTVELEVNYKAFPERNSGDGSKAITDTKGLYFIDPLDTVPDKPSMIWTQGETEHNSKWFPTIDRPNERFTHTIKLTVPDTMVSVSNGKLVKQESLGNGFRKDHWEMDLPHAPYLVAIAVGNFGKVDASHGKIPLGYFVEKGFEKGAAKVFENTPKMMAFFEERLGIPFPWQKYDQIVVRDFVSGAMENTTASIFMEELRMDEREAIDSEWDYIIAHELFHQWFGDLVTTESWANLTLNEAFANYSEYLWNEFYYGNDQAALKLVSEMEGYFAEAEVKQENLIRFDYQDSEDMFDAHSYNKGGVILHMLRTYLGDEAFFQGLNQYLKRHAFQSVEVHDLRLAFEQVSGKDLNWFFNQWFLEKGHPELKIEVDYSQPDNVLISLTQLQDLEENPLYQLPVEVSWYEGKDRRSKIFHLTSANQSFALENEKPVSQVYVDEGKNLLARRTQGISNEEFAQQFIESQLGVARYEALDSLISREAKTELSRILPLALKDSFWSVRENALGFLQSDSEWRNEIEGLEEVVYDLAENDPKNSVRSAAIDLLGEWDPDKYQNAFKRLANHPSYLIAGSALMGLVRASESKLDVSTVENYSGEKNYRMVIPVAEYFIMESVLGKGNWFATKLNELNGEGLYYFLGYYGEYFTRFPNEGKEGAIESLIHLLQTSSKDYIRMGAFQALMGFADQKETLEKIEKSIQGEKSIQLQNYFGYFLEMLKDEN
nr:M1 family metallopeptidase [Algoriphagus sp. AK58]